MSLGPAQFPATGGVTPGRHPADPLDVRPGPIRLSPTDEQTLAAINAAPKVRASRLPLECLANNPTLSEAEKVAEVSRQFEALLLRQILNDAYKTKFASSWNPPSVAKDIYQDMITTQLADSISQSGKFGLASGFQRQLTRPVRNASGSKEWRCRQAWPNGRP